MTGKGSALLTGRVVLVRMTAGVSAKVTWGVSTEWVELVVTEAGMQAAFIDVAFFRGVGAAV